MCHIPRHQAKDLHASSSSTFFSVLLLDECPRIPITSEKIHKAPASPKAPDITSTAIPMSPSIYSRNTDGISIDLNNSVMSLNSVSPPEQCYNSGSAVVLTSQSVRSYVVGTPSQERQDLAHTSRDWRAWLSHEISSMEPSSREDLSINYEYRQPSKRDRSDSMRVSKAENEPPEPPALEGSGAKTESDVPISSRVV